MRQILTAAMSALAVAVAVPGFAGTTYYVDFLAGDDANDGLSEMAPWKRAPGDPAAAGKAASISLAPGDTVRFRGGVAYRGSIVLKHSGAPGAPITYKGDGWGTEPALMEGSDPYRPAWTACASPAACGGNPHYARIYHAQAPDGYHDFRVGLYENGEFLWYAQFPNPADPFHHDEIGGFQLVPHPSREVIQGQASITDPRVLNQRSPTYWDGASVAGWVTGNVVEIRPVTRFDPDAHTLHHQPFGSSPYKDRPGRYALMNHVALIDRQGEYAFDAAAGRIYVWPRNEAAPVKNAYTVAARDSAFQSESPVSHVVVEGFAIRRYGSAVLQTSAAGRDIVVRENDIATLRAHDRYAIQINAQDSLIERNRIRDANRGVGILSSGENVTVHRNHVERASRQGIWFMGARNSRIVGNTVIESSGSHANGISVYAGSAGILVEGNRVLRTHSAITVQRSSDLTFVNNVVAPGGQISDWGGVTGTLAFFNNSFPGAHFSMSSDVIVEFRNNVVRSPPARASRSHNVYTAPLAALQPGEVVVIDHARLFTAPAELDFRPRPGSPLIDGGTRVAVEVDIDGAPRPEGAAWDIGAHESGSATARR